ncbi:MAG: M20/M25/M40 family metallo-hydrolase [Caulobacterales bacterium]|nr:M20/M25/M40 family metallo-hydrolase [Caulobacterales bacterium]
MRLALTLAVLCGLAAPAAAADLSTQVRAWRAAHEAQVVGQLADFAAIPSVAADPAGLQAQADRLQDELKRRGFDARQLSAGAGAPPVVFGALAIPRARRTVVFYAHYDGQPVTPSQWRSDPFKPVMRQGLSGPDVDWRGAKPPYDPEWRLFGRAASDDKSPIVAFLAAFDALQASGRRPSVNLKVVWEGEEERNSPHLETILKQNQALLAADLWLIGDGPLHQSRTRTIYFGARGNAGLEATLYGPLRALHSGHYGNWAPNPAALAAQLITDLRDPQGRIRIPGFADDVRAVTAAERQAIAGLPPVDEALRRELAFGRAESDEGLTLSTMRPALNVTALRAGDAGRAIPAEAMVSFDFRLVPDETPERVQAKTEAYLAGLGWTVVHTDPDAAVRLASAKLVKLDWTGGYPALRSDMTTPAARAVVAAASRAGGGPVAVLPMMGGSVPIHLFADIFQVPVIGLPIVNHDNNQHAANENARLQNLWDGIETYAGLMADLSW